MPGLYPITCSIGRLDADRRFYETMLQRVNDSRVAAAVPESNIRFLGPARAAMQPYKPNWPLNLAIGMFAGLILSASWVMLREQSNSFLRTPGEAGMYLTLPELGSYPSGSEPEPPRLSPKPVQRRGPRDRAQQAWINSFQACQSHFAPRSRPSSQAAAMATNHRFLFSRVRRRPKERQPW